MPRHEHPEMLYRELGGTGERVSAIGLGGFHMACERVDEHLSLRIVHAAVEAGITFMDNCWDYNDGESERRMGRALHGGYRERVFLMTKIDGRTKKEVARQLDQSLRRLRTDHIDLVQHHEVLRYEDPDRIFAEDGANAALVQAREAGKLRYIGFTGHKDPRIHLHMLDVAAEHGFAFDAVQMPLNVLDAHFRSFAQLVLPRLAELHVGVIGMKSLASGVLATSGVVTPIECLRYVLTLPVSVLVVGVDSTETLEQAISAARSFRPLSQGEVQSLLSRTADMARRGEYEGYKTTSVFDGTARHPEWLGDEPERVRRLRPRTGA